MDRRDEFEETDEILDLLDDRFNSTEQLDTLPNEKTEELMGLYYNDERTRNIPKYVPPLETHISDYDEDFVSLVKKRDYKGKVEINNRKEKRSGKKVKVKKWVYLLLILILLGGGFIGYKIYSNKKQAEKEKEEKEIIDNIKSHFNEYAKVSKDTTLYEKDGNSFNKIGIIYKDVNIELEDEEITLDTKYFHIKDLDYYISYEDITEGEKEEVDSRYKNYLVFNTNIVTKEKFTMYVDDDKYITFDESMEFPVIINNYENKYYVEYNNRLVNISKDDVEKTKENKNTEKKNQAKITTLAYHRVYDEGDTCTDGYVCIKKANFDKQMKYLSENNYFTLTLMEEYMYLKGNLQIEKGVVITFDDGYLFKAADEVLDKYGLNGTMFVISGDFIDKFDRFENLKAIDIQSHTHKMHKNYVCAGGNQGGKILCAGKTAIVEDLKKSLELLKVEPIGLAFPFYDYNDTAISALKEVGFKMSFIGRAGVLGKATPKVTDLYKIPRMTVWEENLMSFNSWKSYL